MEKVDVTYSVLIDNASLDYQIVTKRIMDAYKIPIDIAEIAMEKALMELKNEKIKLYATAMRDGFLSQKEEGSKNGNSDN